MELQQNAIFANRYVLEKKLGKGGFSEVWLAQDKLSNIKVALKIGDEAAEFCNELEMVHSLSHPNLLIPRHLDIWDNKPYLVMEYCSQGSCYGRIKKLNEDDIWKLIADVASGLKCMHDHDLLHQDIKPDNILIDDYGNYVITDFGISTLSRKTTKKDEGLAGSRAYMAAERKSMSVRASDIWAFGATLFEIIEGEPPYGDLGGLAQEANDGKIPELTCHLSEELSATINSMLNLQAWNRPSAECLVGIASDHSQIWKFLKVDSPSNGQETPVTPKVSQKNGISKLLVVVLVAAVLVSCVALAIVFNSKSTKNELQERHNEIVSRIEHQEYSDFSDYKDSYNNLKALKQLESSGKYRGDRCYVRLAKEINGKVEENWQSFSDADKQELSKLVEQFK